MRGIFIALTIILVFSQGLLASTYYVSGSGSNGNTGTSWANAWVSINKVNNTVSGGDTVYFGTGVYRGNLIPVSGTVSDRTTYACSSFVEGIAEIWGSDSMGTWTQYSGNVYYSDDFTGTAYYPWEETVLWLVGQKDATYDTVLTRKTSTSLSEGEFYLNGSDRLYVYRFGGGDPSSSQIEPSKGPPVWFSAGQDYVTVWGFKLRYGNLAGVYINNSGYYPHNCNHFEHLNIDWVGFASGNNSGCIQANRGGANNDSASASHGNVIRACSTFHAMEFGTGFHEAGIGLYTMWHTLIESCYVSFSNWGIIDKEQGRYNTFRRNVCENNGQDEGAGIRINNACSNDSIYGNIIIGDGTEPVYGIWVIGQIDGFTHTYDSIFVANNTIFKTGGTGLCTANYGSGSFTAPNWHKYNIVDSVTNTSGGDYGLVALYKTGDDAAWTVIDSNMYYGASINFAADLGNKTWTQWRSNYGFDAHSTSDVDPGFDSVDATDPWKGFARSGASDEMNLTYGGRTWTVFGAVQPGGADTTAPSRTTDLREEGDQ